MSDHDYSWTGSLQHTRKAPLSPADGWMPLPAHPEVVQHLAAYADGELAPIERQAIQSHLEACPDCARELAVMQQVDGLLYTLAPLHPPTAGQSVEASLVDDVLARAADSSWRHTANDQIPLTGWPEDDDDQHHSRATDSTGVRAPRTREVLRPLAPAGNRERGWSHQRRVGAPAKAGLPALVAAVGVTIAAVLIFSLLGSQLRPGAASRPVVIPLHGGLTSISMSSPTNGWAVGTVWTGNQASPLLLHYANGQWQRSHDTFPNADLLGVSADSPDDAWAIGEVRAESADNPDLILHYTGGHWSRMFAQTDPFHLLPEVHAISPEDVWFMGLSTPAPGTAVDAHAGIVLIHYLHGTWQMIDIPNSTAAQFAVTPGDRVWVVTYDGAVLHYAAGKWATQVRGAGELTTITMASTQEGWAAGWAGPNQPLPLLHYDGARWQSVSYPAPAGTWYQVNSISAVPGEPGTVWLAGAVSPGPGHGPLLLTNAGGSWHQVLAPWSTPNNGQIIRMVSPGEGWIIAADVDVAPVLQHDVNGRWTIYRPGQPPSQ